MVGGRKVITFDFRGLEGPIRTFRLLGTDRMWPVDKPAF